MRIAPQLQTFRLVCLETKPFVLMEEEGGVCAKCRHATCLGAIVHELCDGSSPKPEVSELLELTSHEVESFFEPVQ